MSARHEAPLGVTMGEPAGVGPELIARAWNERKAQALPPFLMIGSASCLKAHGLDLPIEIIETPSEALTCFDDALPVLDIPCASPIVPGRPSTGTAPAVIAAIDRAVSLALSGEISAIVTAPIQKSVLMAASFAAPGHTEYLADLCRRPREDAVMMLAIEGLRVVPITVHLPLAAVPAALSQALILHKARITAEALRDRFGIPNPRLAVSGLNPHAGEDGKLGEEEITIIRPAIARLKQEGYAVAGPYAADTLFHAEARAGYDAVLCMYHDQALIPLKTLDFHQGVNLTLGLPLVRTSPDHGTALDIAGKGKARADSLVAAMHLAGRLARADAGRAS